MRRLKAQLMGMFSGKSQTPLDSTYLPDSATDVQIFVHIRVGLTSPIQVGEEIKRSCTDAQELEDWDREEGAVFFRDFEEPVQPMAEPSDSSALDVSEARVGGYVNGDARTRLELLT